MLRVLEQPLPGPEISCTPYVKGAPTLAE